MAHPSLLEKLDDVLRDTAAREILPRFRNLAEADVYSKPSHEDPTDIVTIADRSAERLLTASLRELLPGSVVIGEEAAAADPTLLRLVHGDQPVWIVDPIDGTHNFAEGRGPFGTMVVLSDRGELELAGIYSPLDDEMLRAQRGQGAFRNGERLHTVNTLREPLAGTVYTKFMPPELTKELTPRAAAHEKRPWAMCAAFEYSELARSNKDYVVYHRLMPWDHAPGALILREAGGVSRHPSGRDYHVTDERETLLLAPTQAQWDAAHRALFGG
jgi:fructose-1,6-bisphosphatase/inositol monophosphatase family enzyme